MVRVKNIWPGLVGLFVVVFASVSCDVLTTDDGSTGLQGPLELVTLFNENGEEIPLFEGEVHTVRFGDDGSFNGETACNEHGGNYRADGDGDFTVNQLVSTEELCPDPNHSDAFLNGLSKASRFSSEQGRLILNYGEAGKLVFLERLE